MNAPGTRAEETGLSFLSAEQFDYWRRIRGWLLPAAAEELYRYSTSADPEGAAVEVGSFAGKSTVCIARGRRHQGSSSPVFAVDVQFQPEFRSNLQYFELSEAVSPIEKESLEVADSWSDPVSFLYLDGHHGKAHAFADLVAWDTVVVPGGVVALDDTAGFILGPSLQLQAAVRSGAYDLLGDAGGVSFLRKNRSLLPSIGEYPLSEGSFLAYVHYVSAWLGAMDPAFRVPQVPEPGWLPKPRLGRRGTLRKVRRFLSGAGENEQAKSLSSETARELIEQRGLEAILARLAKDRPPGAEVEPTLSYLAACLSMRLLRIEAAIEQLETLCRLDQGASFLHYEISVPVMARLRLAQAHDLRGSRESARREYERLARNTEIPAIHREAAQGLARPFRLSEPNRELLLREYNLDLSRFRKPVPP